MEDLDHLELDRGELDTIGPWTQRKHRIVTYYAQIYSNILTASKAKGPFTHIYIDGFASSGLAVSRESGRIVRGSALHVHDVKPPFDRFVFVELSSERSDILRRICVADKSVQVITGDANDVLQTAVFPSIKYGDGDRALCFLDPYKLGPLCWDTIVAASRTGAIDLLLHFPVMDINRSVIRKDCTIKPDGAARLTRYWGDESWIDHAFTSEGMLPFGVQKKSSNENLIDAFCRRLREVAGFEYVEGSILLQNSKMATIYYLVIASHNKVAGRVMKDTSRRFGPDRARPGLHPSNRNQMELGF